MILSSAANAVKLATASFTDDLCRQDHGMATTAKLSAEGLRHTYPQEKPNEHLAHHAPGR